MSSFVQLSSVTSHPCGVARMSDEQVSVLLRMKALEQQNHASRLWKVVMMVDVSMSMYHDLARMKSSLSAAIDRIPNGSLIALYTFARDCVRLLPIPADDAEYLQVTQETKERLRAAVGSITCRAGTNMEAAFRLMCGPPDSFYNCFGVCFTDGQPMHGERDPKKLAELLDPSRTVHMIAYKSGSDCWVAKAFGERSVNNIIEYCTDASHMQLSIDRVFPDATKLMLTDIVVDVTLPHGVTLVQRPIGIPDTVEGTTRSLLFDIRVGPVSDDVEGQSVCFTVSLFDGEMQVVEKVVIQRVPRTVAVSVPAEIRAERVRQSTDRVLNRVQNEIRNSNMVEALSAARSASAEVLSLEADLAAEDDNDNEWHSMIVQMSRQCQAIESAISSAHEGRLIRQTVHVHQEEEEEKEEPDQAEEADGWEVPVYRALHIDNGHTQSMRAEEREMIQHTPLPDDFLHQLVAIQNGMIRA